MFQQLIVPVDGSQAALRVVPIAAELAAAVGGKLEVVTVVDRLSDVALARDELARGIADLGDMAITPIQHVLAGDSVAGAIAEHLEHVTGAMVAMSSHGHSRSAAVLGSTADEILRAVYGPVIVIGPHATGSVPRLDGDYLVPLDGSEHAEQVLSAVGAWTVEFGGTPWLVEVIDPLDAGTMPSGDFVESAYVSRSAHELAVRIGREVEFEVLRNAHPAKAIVGAIDDHDASLVFLTTHGRTGMERLRLGSVAAEVIRHATVPAVVVRPPTLQA